MHYRISVNELTLGVRMQPFTPRIEYGVSRIDFWTQKARLWMGKYFPGTARNPGALPQCVAEWLRQRNSVDGELANPEPVFTKLLGEDQLQLRLIQSETFGRMLVMSESRPLTSAKPLEALGLTPRQAEILLHVAQGGGNEEIARRLHISVRTVQKHLESVFKILKVNSRTGASHLANAHLRTVIMAILMAAAGAIGLISQTF